MRSAWGGSVRVRTPSLFLLAGLRGGPSVDAGGIVVMVRSDEARVASDLLGGRVACPVCGGVLGPWGYARHRRMRGEAASGGFRPLRGRCRSCLVTHVLLPDRYLCRRRDPVGVIGAALEAKARSAGHGARRIGRRLGVPSFTVRGWLRRFKTNADRVRSHFTVWAYRLDPLGGPIGPAGSGLADAVEAIGVAARAATLRFGPRPAWGWAAAMSGGWLMGPTRVGPWPAP